MRYATIGTSWITEAFIEGAQTIPGMSFTAAYSRDISRARAFAQKHGAKGAFDSLEQMAKSDIDAVYIASPNAYHYAQSKLFLENGKHVLCEKPLSVRADEVAKLQALAAERSLVYMEAIMMEHQPARNTLIKAMGQIGDITLARLDFCQYSSKYPAYERGELPNIFRTDMAAGCLMDMGVYCVYPAVDFFGPPEEIWPAASLLRGGADASGGALFKYAGRNVFLTYSKTGQGRLGSEIIGDKGTIVIESISRLTGVSLIDLNGCEHKLVGEISKAGLMAEEARSFLDFASGRRMDDYERVKALSLEVCRVMERMREKLGLHLESIK